MTPLCSIHRERAGKHMIPARLAGYFKDGNSARRFVKLRNCGREGSGWPSTATGGCSTSDV
jgi:hypothetical protein